MARFRIPVVFRVVAFLVVSGVGLVFARLTFFGLQWLTLTYVSTVDDYRIQTVSFALMLVSVLTLVIIYISRLPRKVLVFPDHIRIKSMAYRSKVLKPEDLEEVSLRRFHRVWMSRDLFRCYPMTLGLIRPGVYLRPAKGRAYFFRTRDTKELLDVLGAWRGEPITTAVPEPRKKAETKESDGSTPEPVVKKKEQQKGALPPSSKKVRGSSEAKPGADPPPPASAGSAEEENYDDIDFDSIGLTDAEMEDLLGETKRDDPMGDG